MYLFIAYSLALSIAQIIQHWMTGCLVNKESDWMQKEAVSPNLRYYCRTYIDGLQEKTTFQDEQRLGCHM